MKNIVDGDVMRILIDGYMDSNFGDDLMLKMASDGLREHELYSGSDKLNIDNVEYTRAKNGFDWYLKVTGSGFLIHNNAGLLYRMRDMRREKKYAPRRAALNCNISRFINRASEKLIQRQISEYDFITVRDTYSYKYISENISGVRCEKYSDIIFSLPNSMIPDTESEGFLGIAVHNSADCESLAMVADGYIKKTGKRVMLLCFDTGIENDTLAAEKVYKKAKYKDMFEIVRYTSIPYMLAKIKCCAVILGIRFHSVILSARMNIPFVPMAYSEKLCLVLSDINYKNKIYASDNFEAEEVLESVLNAKTYSIDSPVVESAHKHIIKFNEFIKQQR